MDYTLAIVRIFVTDWPRAIDFYTRVLAMTPVFVGDGWAELATGPAHLALERVDPDDPESVDTIGRFVGVSLRVDDIDRVWRDLSSRGVRFVEAPTRQPWGGVLAHFADPDDNILTLLEN
jgi:catechol 2,3-dioxygenase-like lactoylglutathione lyase family enzyme